MFKKIFKFAAGYVIIKITGKNKEKFVSMCLRDFIEIDRLKPLDGGLSLRVSSADFRRMRGPARKCGVRIGIISKHGLRRSLAEHKSRPGFLISGVLAAAFFLISPRYIWCVQIDGARNADTEKIAELLRAHGVYVGAAKSGIDEPREIKSSIIYGVDGVNWAWLYIEGTRARLQIQEETAPPMRESAAPTTDIIAVRDGYIKRADVFRGDRRVNPGMTVSAGDILVSGKVPVFLDGYPERCIYVRSSADIQAETIRSESGVFSSSETLRVKTGRHKTRFSARLLGRRLDLFRDRKAGFADCDIIEKTYDLNLPVFGYTGFSLSALDIAEVNETERLLTEREVISRAKEQLEERICRSLGAGAVKLEERLNCRAEGDNYRIELRMRLRENIGAEVPQTADETTPEE